MANIKWWRERWRRQETASAKLHVAATDSEIIEATADYLIAHGSPRRPYWLHLSILNMASERPVSYEWRYKNAWGISTTDEARARAWVRECMERGYGVSVLHKKHGSGCGMGSVAAIRQQRDLAYGRAPIEARVK
jgi:hypothetical protein